MNVTTIIETVRRRRHHQSCFAGLRIDDVEHLMHVLCSDTDGDEIVGSIACEHLANGGKRIRARLALAAANALGVPTADAIPWAAAVELLHNATLIHDDVQDGDVYRRGRQTAWSAHGIPQAINAGDLMLMAPMLAIERLPASATTAHLSAVLCRRAVATVRGQGADLRLPQVVDDALDDGSNPVDAYFRCIEGKTGELFALPVEGIGLLSGLNRSEAQTLATPFFHLGVLFQLQDDVLDLYGNKGRDVVGSDIKEGKISALVVEHLRLHPDERDWMMGILKRPREQTSDDDIAALIHRFDRGGAKEAVLNRITTLCTLAHHEVEASLRPLVIELVGLVLAPIQHCFQSGDGEHTGPAHSEGVSA